MNLYALLKDNIIKRIPLIKKLQNDLDTYFTNEISAFINKEKVNFNGEYKPEDDQILIIENYDLKDSLSAETLNNPLSVDPISQNEIESIKGLILKNENYIIFQTFDNRKIIRPDKWHLLYSADTFSKIEQMGIAIEQKIDMLYQINEKSLLFFSYHNASKILDLNNYYREATDREIESFLSNDLFEADLSQIDKNLFNSRIRKKIYQIQKNDTLNIVKDKKDKVREYASEVVIELNFNDKNGKIIFPNEKRKIEILINFLNDDIFKSPITDDWYQTNSKIKVPINTPPK